MIKKIVFKKVSWQCIHFETQEITENIKVELTEIGFHMTELDSSLIHDDQSLFLTISDSLGFPDYFGYNWDAMDECLCDLDLSSCAGFVLFCNNASFLWENSILSAGKFVSAWQKAAEEFGAEKKPFHLCFVV